MPDSPNPASSHLAANVLAAPSSTAEIKKASSSGESRDTASTAALTPSSPSLAASPYPDPPVEDDLTLEDMAEKIDTNDKGDLGNKQEVDPQTEAVTAKKEINNGKSLGTETACKKPHCTKHKCAVSKPEKSNKKKKKQKADSSSSSDSSSSDSDSDSSTSSSSSSSSDSSDTESISSEELELLKKLKKKKEKAKRRAKKSKAKKSRSRKAETSEETSDSDDEVSTDEDKARKRKAMKKKVKKLREAIESVDDDGDDDDEDAEDDQVHQSRRTTDQTGTRRQRLRYSQNKFPPLNSRTPPAQQRTAAKAQAKKKRASKVAFKRVDQREFLHSTLFRLVFLIFTSIDFDG